MAKTGSRLAAAVHLCLNEHRRLCLHIESHSGFSALAVPGPQPSPDPMQEHDLKCPKPGRLSLHPCTVLLPLPTLATTPLAAHLSAGCSGRHAETPSAQQTINWPLPDKSQRHTALQEHSLRQQGLQKGLAPTAASQLKQKHCRSGMSSGMIGTRHMHVSQ